MEKKKPVLYRIKTYHIRLILAIAFVFFSTAGVIFYWLITGRAEQMAVERVRNQELIITRSGALSIADFFEERKTSLLLLAEIEAVKAGKEEEGRGAIKSLVDQLKDQPFASTVRVSKEGKSLWSENPQHQKVEEGIDVSDRDYFTWAEKQKNPGEIFISQPLIARSGLAKGEWIVVIATPVFYQNEFNGLVLISLPLKDLTEKYVSPLISSPSTHSFIIAQNGTIIVSTIPALKERNVLSDIQQREWEGKEEFLQMTQEALAGKEGSAVVSCYQVELPSAKGLKTITAYSPIEIDGSLWSLWISAPYEEAIGPASSLLRLQSLGFAFGAASVLVVALLFVFGVRIAQRDSFINGFLDGRDGVKSVTLKKRR